MLNNIIDLVRQNAGDTIVNNPAIPNEKNDEAVNEAGNSIIDTLKSFVSGGKAQDLIGMLSGGQADSSAPVVQQASGDLTNRLQNKFGLDQLQASGIAGGLVTKVLQQLGQRTADPNDNGFDLQDILKQLGGGQLSSLLGGGGGSVVDKLKGMF